MTPSHQYDVVDREKMDKHFQHAVGEFCSFIKLFIAPFMNDGVILESLDVHFDHLTARVRRYPVLYTTQHSGPTHVVAEADMTILCSPKVGLMQLPPEIQQRIFEAAEERSAWQLAQTCKQLHRVAMPTLFEQVTVEPYSIAPFVATIRSKHFTHTRELEFADSRRSENPSHTFHLLEPSLNDLVSLRSLKVKELRPFKHDLVVLIELIKRNKSLCRLSLNIVEDGDAEEDVEERLVEALGCHTKIEEIEIRSWATTVLLPNLHILFPYLRTAVISAELYTTTLEAVSAILEQPTLCTLRLEMTDSWAEIIEKDCMTTAKELFAANSTLVSLELVAEQSSELHFMLEIIKGNRSIERLALQFRSQELDLDIVGQFVINNKRLKELTLSGEDCFGDAFIGFDQFAPNAAQQISLEKLGIVGIEMSDSEFDKIVRLLEINTNLHEFALDGVEFITVDHCRELARALKSNERCRITSLKIMLGSDGLHWMPLEEVPNLVEVYEKLRYLSNHGERRANGRYVFVKPFMHDEQPFSMTFHQFFGLLEEED
ncbi:hypothetical protein BJ742DRAFT_548930 [Cladochytrium replicatum]|nr:hypothetical protein BJ742DRAFT_548930 [Cladochytrium replicatum]